MSLLTHQEHPVETLESSLVSLIDYHTLPEVLDRLASATFFTFQCCENDPTLKQALNEVVKCLEAATQAALVAKTRELQLEAHPSRLKR